MKQSFLYALWGALFILCAGLGFVPAPGSALRILMTLLSVAFFIPGALLLKQARRSKNPAAAIVVRNLSMASLVLSALLIVANFLSALAGAWLGSFLHILLVIVSSPMVCSGFWALSLFLWACLMIAAARIVKNSKT